MDRGQWFGLSATTFMVSSKMDGSDPHFDVGSIATHNMSWDLESNRGRLIRLGEMSEDYAQPLHRGTGALRRKPSTCSMRPIARI